MFKPATLENARDGGKRVHFRAGLFFRARVNRCEFVESNGAQAGAPKLIIPQMPFRAREFRGTVY